MVNHHEKPPFGRIIFIVPKSWSRLEEPGIWRIGSQDLDTWLIPMVRLSPLRIGQRGTPSKWPCYG